MKKYNEMTRQEKFLWRMAGVNESREDKTNTIKDMSKDIRAGFNGLIWNEEILHLFHRYTEEILAFRGEIIFSELDNETCKTIFCATFFQLFSTCGRKEKKYSGRFEKSCYCQEVYLVPLVYDFFQDTARGMLD